KYFPEVVEPSICRCLYLSCSDVSPFGSTQALAYHMSVKHTLREEKSVAIPCLLCSKKFITTSLLYTHIRQKHARVKNEHIAYRMRETDDFLYRRKGRRVKSKNMQRECQIRVRSRSLSPDCKEELFDSSEIISANKEGNSVSKQKEKRINEHGESCLDQTCFTTGVGCEDRSPGKLLPPKRDGDKGGRSNSSCSNIYSDEEKVVDTNVLRVGS
ncbi:zinc finger, C2H2 type, partial [Necator americanus]